MPKKINLTGTRNANSFRIVDINTNYSIGAGKIALLIQNIDGTLIQNDPSQFEQNPFSSGIVVFHKNNANLLLRAQLGFMKRDLKKHQAEGLCHFTASFTVEENEDGNYYVTRIYNVKAHYEGYSTSYAIFPEF